MNDYIAFSAYFGAALTLSIYVVSFRISDRIGHPLANPILICLALLIGALLIFDIDYDAYNQCARLIKKQREVFGSGYRKKPQNMTRTAALRFRNTQKRSRANKNRIQPTGTPRTRNVSPGRFLFENLSFSQVKSRRK